MKKQFSIFRQKKADAAFTLILAALISSIVLSIGAAIFAIALKQVTLASAGKNSQLAFYAADTAAECGLYWDVRHAGFATSSSSAQPLATIQCDSVTPITVALSPQADGSAVSTFSYAPNGFCADVWVKKSRDATTNGVVTVIHANGYSTRGTGVNDCAINIASDKKTLQRSVELHY